MPCSRFSKLPEYSRDYYYAHRERMSSKSLECYYRRKEIQNTNPKDEYKKIINLFKKGQDKCSP